MNETIAFLIPSYCPSEGLVDLVNELVRENGNSLIFVVNDGSGEKYNGVFEKISSIKNVVLISHAINLGKGGALKTGLNRIFADYPRIQGVVTLDADGQHKVIDAKKVADELHKKNNLVLGVRVFDLSQVPWRSQFGNNLTKKVFYVVTGMKLSDTQTGLRGIPRKLALECLKIRSNGYEFETDMLLLCSRERVSISEIPIETVYIDGNSSSHFNPILDSLKIYFVLLRFALNSMVTAIIDSMVFSVVYLLTGKLLLSTFVGRCVAGTFNFTTSKYAVFRSSQNFKLELMKYVGLVIFLMLVSNAAIKSVVALTEMNVIVVKVLIETALFPISFAMQRLFVFSPKPDEIEA